MAYPKTEYYTYLEKRKCLHCGCPIPDQASHSRKYCPREELPDGTILNCKDDYHSPRRKENNQPFKEIADYHKMLHARLRVLWILAPAGNVSLEELDQYDINLTRPVQFTVDKNQVVTYYFIEYAITQSANKQFKILKHDNQFK